SCTSNPQPDIEDRVRHLEERFVDGFCQVMGKNKKSISQQRYQLAVRLYYRVLEKMLKAEEDRLSRADFSTLLNNDTFHKSLLACAVEVVMAAYASTVPGNATPSSTDTAFPWVLAVFGLQAYNFHKVLESFIRAEPCLPRETIKHIQSIENQILEKIAWKSDSPLFDLLKSTEIPAPSIPVSPGVKEQPKNGGKPVTAAQLYLSPTNGLQATCKMADTAQVIASSSVRQTPPKRSHSLNLFFNKVSRLAYHRLQDLCTLLAIPKDMQLKIWTCLEHCITRKPDLLRDRHLDQVMLCSVYAIHKVISTDTELKFKTIVHMYKSMPHATQEVFKNTLISGNEYDSIIGFYNRVFMQATKNVILQFSPSRSSNPGSLTLSPVPKNIQSPLTASPVYSVPGRKNFYVSPLKSPTFKAPISPSQMTPRTRQLYSFGEGFGSSEKLKSINDTLRAMKRTSPTAVTPKSQKRLRFDQPDQDRRYRGCLRGKQECLKD
ncbi:retinoblastoma-associated protein-like, partial [Lingula anatina]|uniref:Retinoblastoma-associated protein-like n=1 Tax=Lingula anatina TaxID=7574 RepID=A0A1S3J163_LINAN